MGKKIPKKRDLNENKRASMTMKKHKQSSHTPLSTAFPRYLAYLPKHQGVRAETCVEYVQSTCKVCAKYVQKVLEVMGPVPPGGGYNRRTHPGGTPLSLGEQLITSVRII